RTSCRRAANFSLSETSGGSRFITETGCFQYSTPPLSNCPAWARFMNSIVSSIVGGILGAIRMSLRSGSPLILQVYWKRPIVRHYQNTGIGSVDTEYRGLTLRQDDWRINGVVEFLYHPECRFDVLSCENRTTHAGTAIKMRYGNSYPMASRSIFQPSKADSNSSRLLA